MERKLAPSRIVHDMISSQAAHTISRMRAHELQERLGVNRNVAPLLPQQSQPLETRIGCVAATVSIDLIGGQ